jgi:AraC-like DNA-binding protein
MIEEASPRMSATGTVGLMARAVQKRTPSSGDHHTAIPELTLHRRNKSTQVVHCIYTLGMSITLQGSKHVLIGDKQLSYGPGQSMLAAIDLPISYHITRATAAEPYLGVMLKFDQSLLVQVASTLEKPHEDKAMFEPISLQRLGAPVLDALHRLLLLLDEPKLIPQLSPLIQHEIVVRLLNGPHAPHLWNLILTNGPTQKIAQAANWIRQHFAEEMRVNELAETTNMSPTTFRQHFRSMTGMSPVQFQKLLRLQEARQLMLDQNMSAGSACALVGYESASQFNREYKRLFGAPPQADVRKMAC